VDRLSEAVHIAMGVSMVAMIWPWGRTVPPAVWVAVFAASTGWFLFRAVRAAGRRFVLGLFATSMAACAWMGATMPAQASGARGDAVAMGGSAMDGSAMGGSAMDGMTMGAGHLTTTGVVSGLLGGCLVVAAGWWFRRGLRLGSLAAAPDPRPFSFSALCHGLMSAAMGLALLTMA
jgi:hypothetical protein